MHSEEEFDKHCDEFGFRIWILVIQLGREGYSGVQKKDWKIWTVQMIFVC
jgi:hypothetical protein